MKPDNDHTCRPTIVAFLAARYDDLAMDAGDIHYWSCKNSGVAGWHLCDCPAPRQLRADIAAKRRILAEHMPTTRTVEWEHDTDGKGNAPCCPRCQNAEHSEWYPPVGEAGVLPAGFVTPYVLAPCRTLLLLAAPFASHPDFDPAWAVPV